MIYGIFEKNAKYGESLFNLMEDYNLCLVSKCYAKELQLMLFRLILKN